MPAKEHPPISVMAETPDKFRTICQVHREAWALLESAEDIDPELKRQLQSMLEEAYNMGTRMNIKLREYRDLSTARGKRFKSWKKYVYADQIKKN